jgi:hypothetical protein
MTSCFIKSTTDSRRGSKHKVRISGAIQIITPEMQSAMSRAYQEKLKGTSKNSKKWQILNEESSFQPLIFPKMFGF